LNLKIPGYDETKTATPALEKKVTSSSARKIPIQPYQSNRLPRSVAKLEFDHVPTPTEKEFQLNREFLVPQPSVKKLQIDQALSAVSPLFDRSARQKMQRGLNTVALKDDEPPATPYKPSDSQKPKPSAVLVQPRESYTPIVSTQIEDQTSNSSLARPTPKKAPPSFNKDPLNLNGRSDLEDNTTGRLYNNYTEFAYDVGLKEPSGPPAPDSVPLPKCTSEGVVLVPRLEILAKFSEEDLKRVKDFTVIREGCGSIQFEGETDVRGLNIDKIIQIQSLAVVVYPNEKEKPPKGKGLNKPAIIKIEKCWPLHEQTNRPMLDDDSIADFVRRLKRRCHRYHTTFISYDRKNGEWTFRAEDFD